MRRGIIVAVTAISMTGAASASIFTNSAVAPAPQPPVTEKSAVLAKAPIAVPPAEPVQAPQRAPVQRASLEGRQAPVPMQTRHRVPVASPWDSPNEFYAKAQALVGRPAAPSERSGEKASGEKAARAAIEADGYRGVQDLRRGNNGVWHAKALRGKTEVQLTVNARGAVTTAGE